MHRQIVAQHLGGGLDRVAGDRTDLRDGRLGQGQPGHGRVAEIHFLKVLERAAGLDQTRALDGADGDVLQILEAIVDRATQVAVRQLPKAVDRNAADVIEEMAVGVLVERLPGVFEQDQLSADHPGLLPADLPGRAPALELRKLSAC